MSDPTISFVVPCEAIRVFWGFPLPKFTEARFFEALGTTFMPGTPYMIQPLGLAAYLPGVLSNPAPGLPHEFALICYPSPAVYHHAMKETLRGRVYGQTHGGVYSFPDSGAAFPSHVNDLPAAGTAPYFLFRTPIDWQSGVTHVVVGGPAEPGQSGPAFRAGLRGALGAVRDALPAQGIDQVVVAAHDTFAVVWFHGHADSPPVSLDFLRGTVGNLTELRHERVVCVDEPPTLQLDRSRAFNFIFLREEKYFLE